MNDRGQTANLAALVRGRTPLAVAGAPLLFVFFGVFLPAAGVARFAAGFEIGVGCILAASSAAVFAIERRLAGAHDLRAAAQFRELVGVMVGSALLVWALLRLPLAALLRSGEFWAAVVAAALVFLLSSLVRRRTARWEFFLTGVVRMAVAGREGPESEAIAAVTRELSVEAGEADDAMRSVRRWLIFFLVWSVALLVVLGWGLRIAGTVEQIGVSASSLVFLAALTAVGRMREEQFILTLGLVPAKTSRPVATGTSLVLFSAAAVLAAVLSLQPALISQSTLAAIGSWIAWLLSRIPSRGPRSTAPPPPHPIFQPPSAFAERLRSIAPGNGSHLAAAILTYLAWSLAAAAAVGLLWLLLAPLFRLHRPGLSFAAALAVIGKRLAGGLHRWWLEIRSVFSGLREARGSGVPLTEPATDRARRRRRGRGRTSLVRALFGGADRRFAGAFRNLTRWGEARGAAFAVSLGPREYTTMLASQVPSVHGALDRIAELYERHLFAPEPLSGRERSDYFRMIKEVISSGGR